MRSEKGLDWVNFLLADVQSGVGPFLAIYLWSSRHWDATHIGIVMTIAGAATVAARAPAGALVDWTRRKRTLIAVGALFVAAGSAGVALFPFFWPVAAAEVVIGACDALFPPAIAAISLGVVGRALFSERIGRNEAFNHAGNVVTAVAAGLAGWLIAPVAVLWLAVLLACATVIALRMIDAREIDHRAARGLADADANPAHVARPNVARPHLARPSGLGVIFESRPLLIFTAAMTLFFFANAAMITLIGERLSEGCDQAGPLFMAACIIVAQATMIPMAALVGAKADLWGRKPLLLMGFAALPIRGLLYTFVDEPLYFLAIQLLDGVGAGLLAALFFIVIDDLTEGTGHYSLALGASGACWGAGSALSNVVAGALVDRAGFDATFLFLSFVAALGFLLLWLAMPESATPAPSAA